MSQKSSPVTRGGTTASAAVKTPDVRKQLDGELSAIATAVKKFRIDVQRFFSGDLKLPPDDLRERIAGDLRRLQNAKGNTAAESFRLNSIEAQFNSQVELFGRRLREREQGGQRLAVAARPAPQYDPDSGVVVGMKPSEGAVEALYKGLFLRGGAGTPQMDLERFRGYIVQQADAIRAKTGCAEIQFRVAEEDGKMKIKAKPIRKDGAA